MDLRAATIAGVLLLLASPTLAQEVPDESGSAATSEGTAPEPENASAVREARQHYEAANAHFEARNFRSAIEEFQLAARLVPSADLWFNIARSHEEVGELDEAVAHFRLYLRDRVDPPDRVAVEQRIERLESQIEAAAAARQQAPTTGTLRIAAGEGATLRLDGEAIGTSPLASSLELEPGRHELEVERDGYIPFRSVVSIEAGLSTAAYVDLQPATQYRAVRGRRLWTWIVGGLAVAGAGAAIGLGAVARSRRSEDLGEARDFARYSDIALGSALALGVGAVILYFIEGRAVDTERYEGVAAP
ncbi:MAG: PEGA domain-containing protein [Myxococcota bacterium]